MQKLERIFSVRFSPTLHQQVDQAAAAAGQTPSGFVRLCVEERLQSLGHNGTQGGQDAQGQAQGERVGVQYG